MRIPNNFSKTNKSSKKLQSPNSKQILSKYKILIAEDDESSFNYLQYILKDVSESIIRATDGLEAIELAKNDSNINIILMDIKMPKLNGYEATKEIRKFNESIFIIAQTAYAQESDKAKSIEVGCNAYISKPINKQKLLELISQYQN